MTLKQPCHYQPFVLALAPPRKMDRSVQPTGAMFAGAKPLFDRGQPVLVNKQVLKYMKTRHCSLHKACLFICPYFRVTSLGEKIFSLS